MVRLWVLLQVCLKVFFCFSPKCYFWCWLFLTIKDWVSPKPKTLMDWTSMFVTLAPPPFSFAQVWGDSKHSREGQRRCNGGPTAGVCKVSDAGTGDSQEEHMLTYDGWTISRSEFQCDSVLSSSHLLWCVMLSVSINMFLYVLVALKHLKVSLFSDIRLVSLCQGRLQWYCVEMLMSTNLKKMMVPH